MLPASPIGDAVAGGAAAVDGDPRRVSDDGTRRVWLLRE